MNDALLRLTLIVIAAITLVSGAAQLAAGKLILSVIAPSATGPEVHLFSTVGMFMVITGAMFCQSLISRTDAPAISFWIAVQKLAAAVLVFIAWMKGYFLWFALGVVVIDIGKGAVAAGLVPALNLPFAPNDPAVSREWLAMCCAAAAVCGHVWPMYHRFQGGKGAATFIGTLLVLGPMLVLPLLLIWAWVLTMSGYVGLSTMAAAVFLPVWIAITRLPDEQPLFIYAVAMALFIIYCHRSNIRRMRDGNEHRNDKLMVFRRRATAGGKPEIDDDA